MVMPLRALRRSLAIPGAFVFLFAFITIFYLGGDRHVKVQRARLPTAAEGSKSAIRVEDRAPCVGPRGKLLSESPDDLIRTFDIDARKLDLRIA